MLFTRQKENKKLYYTFHCNYCNVDTDLEIPISKYDELKNKQKCPFCKKEIHRKIEWTGTATGYGSGWFGRSDGGKTI